MRRAQAARSSAAETAQTPRDQRRSRFAQFAGQFQHHVAAEREADQESRRGELAQKGQQVAGQAGMIERVAEVSVPPQVRMWKRWTAYPAASAAALMLRM